MTELRTDLLVVGAGPAGASAAAWNARNGREVLVIDKEDFPRDKTCGDGLTPRAIKELRLLGLADWLENKPINIGLRGAGFGREWLLPWSGGAFPTTGSAVARVELDAQLVEVAKASGAQFRGGLAAQGVEFNGSRISAVVCRDGAEEVRIHADRVIVADGARSQLGRHLGRTWHKDTVYGVAARAYINSARSNDPWISSHLELRNPEGEVLSGYGWVFPLGNGQVNIGVGTLANDKHPANVNLRELLRSYTDMRRDDWHLSGEVSNSTSALLPMGGSVTGIAGQNWLFIGDAAGCINPLNGEGIDYGLETGRLSAEIVASDDLSLVWPQLLQEHYGAAYSIARRLSSLLTIPGLLPALGPWGMKSRRLMKVALRVMGNLVTPEDEDLVGRAWLAAGRLSSRFDARPPFTN